MWSSSRLKSNPDSVAKAARVPSSSSSVIPAHSASFRADLWPSARPISTSLVVGLRVRFHAQARWLIVMVPAISASSIAEPKLIREARRLPGSPASMPLGWVLAQNASCRSARQRYWPRCFQHGIDPQDRALTSPERARCPGFRGKVQNSALGVGIREHWIRTMTSFG